MNSLRLIGYRRLSLCPKNHAHKHKVRSHVKNLNKEFDFGLAFGVDSIGSRK